MANVVINGATIDADDPCALYAALNTVLQHRMAGEAVEELTIQSPLTRETVRFSAIGIADFKRHLSDLAAACRRKRGLRSRGAMRMTHIY